MGTSIASSSDLDKVWGNSDLDMKNGTVKIAEMLAALDAWGQGLVAISQAHALGDDAKRVAEEKITASYNYADGKVLFKPTLTSKVYFRPTFEGALSYFVGGNPLFKEDNGFALNPWAKVDFELSGFVEGQSQGLVMGNKLLTKTDGSLVVANFTMGFTRTPNGKLKINLHHSSIPFSTN